MCEACQPCCCRPPPPCGSFKFVRTSPDICQFVEAHLLERQEYTVWLEVKDLNPCRDIQIHAWTNQLDTVTSNDEYHAVCLKYIGMTEGLCVYGAYAIITGDGEFQFTFCAKLVSDQKFTKPAEQYGKGLVLPARPRENWAQELRESANCTPIIGPIHLGNEQAAIDAKRNGFTHVLCVSVELEKPFKDTEIAFYKVPMQYGVQNPLAMNHIQDAVTWLRENRTVCGCKILVYCRAGFGRAGSTMLAYVFSLFRTMSYEDALCFIACKRPMFQHRGLKRTLMCLYPRMCCRRC